MGTTGKDYVTENPDATEGTTAPETDEVTNPPKTNAQTTTKVPTNAPENTTKEPSNTTASTPDDTDSAGCGGFAGIGAIFAICVSAAAFAVLRKKY